MLSTCSCFYYGLISNACGCNLVEFSPVNILFVPLPQKKKAAWCTIIWQWLPSDMRWAANGVQMSAQMKNVWSKMCASSKWAEIICIRWEKRDVVSNYDTACLLSIIGHLITLMGRLEFALICQCWCCLESAWIGSRIDFSYADRSVHTEVDKSASRLSSFIHYAFDYHHLCFMNFGKFAS